jgi:uncharacterized membrane protein
MTPEVCQMAVINSTRLRLWWERAFWVIPTVGVAGGVVLSEVVSGVDDEFSTGLQLISAASTAQLLAAIGGGMVTFTGFVFSFVVLLLQFGSSQYSPRTVSYFLRARATRVILAIFLGTVTFTFMSLLDVGSYGRPDYTPALTVLLAVLLLFVSLAAFIWLLHSVGSRMRVDAVLSDLGRRARVQLAVLVGPRSEATLPVADEAPGDAQIVRSAESGQVIAVDQAGLTRVAARNGLRIWVARQVGDAITAGAPLVRVAASDGVEVTPMLAARLRRAVVVDSERSLRYDPFYALRLLVDIAIKALSPGINDPTTAVRALDEIEGVLRVAARLHLGDRQSVRGEGQVVVPAPSWSDVVALGVLEIMVFGAGQPQITRRVTALIDDLWADVGEELRPPLEQMRVELASLLAAESFDPQLRRIAVAPDRQGLGGRLGVGPESSAPAADPATD